MKNVIKKRMQVVLLGALLVMTPGCKWFTRWFGGLMGTKAHDVRVISVEDAQKKMAEPDVWVINVLSEEAYNDCHILGSLNVPLKKLKTAAEKWNKEQEIIVYCASYTCPASKEAFKVLKELGFANIWAYEGGMKEWKQKGLDSVGPCVLDYLK